MKRKIFKDIKIIKYAVGFCIFTSLVVNSVPIMASSVVSIDNPSLGINYDFTVEEVEEAPLMPEELDPPLPKEILEPKNKDESSKKAEPEITTEVTSDANDNNKYLVLVNQNNILHKDYVPEKTVDISKYVKSTKSEMIMEEEAGYRLVSMLNAMETVGINDIATVSGYRSYSYQDGLFKRQMSRYSNLPYDAAYKKASRVVAPAGQSEHQTGLAVDVSSKEVGYSLYESFKETKAYSWLCANAYKYGYIVRYTEEKQELTGIIYEPWHLRYVGVEAATSMYKSGLCFEEYIALTQVLTFK